MALADTLKTDMGKPPVTEKPAAVKPSTDLIGQLQPGYEELKKRAADYEAKTKAAGEAEVKQREMLPSALKQYDVEERAQRKPLEEGLTFKPDMSYMRDVSNLFMIVGMLGAFIGGKGSTSAAANSQAALTGMMQGLVKGDDAEYARQKAVFDENSKYLSKQVEDIKEAFKQHREDAIKNGIAYGDSELSQAFNASGADSFKALNDAKGSKAAFDAFKSVNDTHDKMIETATRLEEQKRRDTQAELDRREARAERMAMFAERQKGGRASVLLQGRAENIREAITQVAADVKNISKFPKGTVLSAFSGMTGQEGDTLYRSLSNTFARAVSDKESRMLQQLVSGLEQNMASALGGGYATSIAKGRVEAYKAQVPKAGDSAEIAANFLARVRQEMNILAENFPTKPGATEGMVKAVEKANNDINEAVPFTVDDVLEATFNKGGKPIPTAEDRKRGQSNPTSRQNFIRHFGVEP